MLTSRMIRSGFALAAASLLAGASASQAGAAVPILHATPGINVVLGGLARVAINPQPFPPPAEVVLLSGLVRISDELNPQPFPPPRGG